MFEHLPYMNEENSEYFQNSFFQFLESENVNCSYNRYAVEKLNEDCEERLYFIKPLDDKKEIPNTKDNKEGTTATSNKINIQNPSEPQKINLENEESSDAKSKKIKNSSLGRKKKGDLSVRSHTKSREDNKMRKIKVHIIRFILNRLNLIISKYHLKFLKIDKKVGEDLKKDFNLRLMDMTIKQILTEFSINGRYLTLKNEENLNVSLIKDIYAKNDTEAIKILESKFIDLLKILRTEFLHEFKHDILRKEIKCGEKKENAEKYVNELVKLLFKYENWFSDKSGRRRK